MTVRSASAVSATGITHSRRRLLVLSLAAVAGGAVVVASFYPGYMSFDSVMQLGEARTGMFTDAHPPLMALLWRLVDSVSPGPQGMLVLHNLIFFTGAALLCALAIDSTSASAAVLLLFGLFPPVFALLGTIWKDVGLGVSLLLGFALLLKAAVSKSKYAFIGSIACLFYALAVRHNGVLAVLPLTVWAGPVFANLFLSRPDAKRSVWSAVAIFAALLASVSLANRALTHGRSVYHYQGFVLHDVLAISIAKSHLYLPPYTYWDADPPSSGDLKEIYDPTNIVPMFGGTPAPRHLKFTGEANEAAELRKAWLHAVLDAPGAYLNHRWIMFKIQLGLGKQPVCYPYHWGIEDNNLGVSLRPSRLNEAAMRWLDKLRDTFLFRTWFYVALILALMLLFRWLPPDHRAPAWALAASSLMYELGYFFVAPTCDFRFNWWTVIATIALVIYVTPPLVHRFRTSHA
jgi:hypothetical protein